MGASFAAQINRASLLAHLKQLEGERHPFDSPDRLQAAQDYLHSHWRALGFHVVQDAFPYLGRTFVNLIARPQPDRPGPRLIIGAHLDTVPGTPGADDNASGLAALLEISRVFAAQPADLNLEFAAFTLEELRMLGSTHYAQTLHAARVPLR